MGDECAYRIKRVNWPPWSSTPRSVPILLQDVNGPCPLIAMLNVLLLRGTLNLPNHDAGEVTEARAVQMLAEHLLDSNFSRAEGSSEYRANLQHNLSDAISLLPKLTTGIDVNVRFDGVRSLEYTGEIAVFDLLGIDLVHGWLYDPQDVNAAAAVGERSYNDLVMQIVSALGGEATPSALSRRSTPPGGVAIGIGFSGERAPTLAPPTGQPNHKIDAETLSAALQSSLRVTIPDDPNAGFDLKSRSTADSALSQDSVTSAINKMLGETVKEAFKTPTPGTMCRPSFDFPLAEPSYPPQTTAFTESSAVLTADAIKAPEEEPTQDLITLEEAPSAAAPAFEELLLPLPAKTEQGTDTLLEEVDTADREEESRVELVSRSDHSALAAAIHLATETSASAAAAAVEFPESIISDEQAQPQAQKSPFASVAQEENENENSQEGPLTPSPSRASILVDSSRTTTPPGTSTADVTIDTIAVPVAVHGPPSSIQPPATPPAVPSGAAESEAAVHDALVAREFLESNPSQLTVCGLSALMDGMADQQLAVFFRNNHFNVLLRSGNGLYILVTDQGYLYESDVMWEHLSNVDGDTELLGWDLKPFRVHTGAAGGEATTLASEAALSYPSGGLSLGGGGGDISRGGTLPEHAQHADADFALAMQLQQEEEERVRVAEERRRVEALRRQELRPVAGGGGSGASGRQQQVQGQTRPGSGKKKKKSPDCSIM